MRAGIAWVGQAGFAVLGLAAPAASQGLSPAPIEEILAGAQSCAAATASAGVDGQKLDANGWHKASMSDNGKAVASSLSFYSKGKLLLTFDTTAALPVCFISARLPSVGEFPKLQAAMKSIYGAPIKDDGKGEQIFIGPDRRMVDLASTGSRERPAVRIAVGAVIQETK